MDSLMVGSKAFEVQSEEGASAFITIVARNENMNQ